MPRKKPKPLTPYEKHELLKRAALNGGKTLQPTNPASEGTSLHEQIAGVLRILRQGYQTAQRPDGMLFFVMYDIEDHKVRRRVAEYLLAAGCERIQKSVYLAHLNTEKFEQISQDLKAVQEAYDNEDSIMLVPASKDQIAGMRMIGQQLDVEMDLLQQGGMEWF